jgi:hypothetical protein
VHWETLTTAGKTQPSQPCPHENSTLQKKIFHASGGYETWSVGMKHAQIGTYKPLITECMIVHFEKMSFEERRQRWMTFDNPEKIYHMHQSQAHQTNPSPWIASNWRTDNMMEGSKRKQEPRPQSPGMAASSLELWLWRWRCGEAFLPLMIAMAMAMASSLGQPRATACDMRERREWETERSYFA